MSRPRLEALGFDPSSFKFLKIRSSELLIFNCLFCKILKTLRIFLWNLTLSHLHSNPHENISHSPLFLKSIPFFICLGVYFFTLVLWWWRKYPPKPAKHSSQQPLVRGQSQLLYRRHFSKRRDQDLCFQLLGLVYCHQSQSTLPGLCLNHHAKRPLGFNRYWRQR